MSLLILIAFFSLGLIPLGIMRELEFSNSSRAEEFGSLINGYMTILLLAAIACLGFGVFGWLKSGEWLTLSPEYFISYLGNENPIREVLLSETSWVGVQELSNWYLQQNLGWSFLLTIIVVFAVLAGTAE